MIKKDKRGLAGSTITAIVGLIFTLIIAFVLVAQITGAGLLDAGDEKEAVDNMTANLTAGVNEISAKIPTFFLIIAAVLIIGFVVILWAQAKRTGLMTSGGL